MAHNLFDLFRDKLKDEHDLIASDPQTLESISSSEEEQNLIVEKFAELENVELKVDYSDFSNHVFFNSALDYFNITGEKIINDYPIDGTIDSIKKFEKDLDGYQNHILKSWPSYAGHLRFNPGISSSFITVNDVGYDENSATYRVGILSPNTGSLSIELWFNAAATLTGTEDIHVLAQKLSASDGYTLYLTGSEVRFRVTSGSVTNEVSSSFVAGQNQYVAGVMNRLSHTGSLTIMTGSSTQFPVIVESSSLGVYGSLDLAGVNFTMASGTLGTKVTRIFTGSLDDVRVWKKVRTIADISSSFNVKQHAQRNLVALFRFNETGSFATDNIVKDYSGKKLDGTISNYYTAIRGSGSLLYSEYPDPVLDIVAPEVSAFILQNQISGSAYDRQNSNKITDMFPEKYFTFNEEIDTDVFKNFLYVFARNFDQIKLHIDQFLNILTVNYGKYNQTPDVFLDVVAKFFGWEFTGNFLNADAFQYLLGRNVLAGVSTNSELDKKLFQIKNEFWRRVLTNLVYIYKSKGTKESIKAMLRSYGVNENFVRIKEFGYTPNVGIQTKRISAEKSIAALGFGSGSLSGSITISNGVDITTGDFSVETRIKFPLTSSLNIQPSGTSGSLWSFVSGGAGFYLIYEKDSVSSHSGTLTLSNSLGITPLSMSSVGVFNNEWQNISAIYNAETGSLELSVRELDVDDFTSYLTSSIVLSTAEQALVTPLNKIVFGATASLYDAEYWMQEARVWDKALEKEELDDHTLNFQSYGTNDPNVYISELKHHLRLNENINSDSGGQIMPIEDIVPGNISLTGSNFAVSQQSYKKFLNRYNYIASLDFGWNEDKIRIFNASEVKASQFVNDTKAVSLEFNMIDALNEDIVQIMNSLDLMNEAIGLPANKYRVHYDDLEILRLNYFKRLQGRLNFTIFADLLEFFDRSFIDMVKRLIPARAHFTGDEFVVESHMLERPKVTYERRKFQDVQFAPEGRIEVWTRFGRNNDKSGSKVSLLLPKS